MTRAANRPSTKKRLGLVSSLVVGLVFVPSAAFGLFADPVSIGSNSLSTATLHPPTNVAASATCAGPDAASVSVGWTGTVSDFAAGYELYRGPSAGGPYTLVAQIEGRNTTSAVDSPVSTDTTYYYVVRSSYQNWRSVDSNEATVTTPAAC